MAEQNEGARTSETGGLIAGEIHVRGASVADVSGQRIGLTQCSARDVTSEETRIVMSAAQSIRGRDVSAAASAALQVDAHTAKLGGCAVGIVEADQVDARYSGTYAVMGENVNLNSCWAQAAMAKEQMRIERSAVGVAAARQIEATDVRAGFLVAREVRGTVRTLFDTRAAAVFGAAFGAAFAAVWLLRRR